MAKRLSSLFSLSREDKDHSQTQYATNPPSLHTYPQNYNYGHAGLPGAGDGLQQPYWGSASNLALSDNLSPLAPPPLMSDSGAVRPPSSHRSGLDSRPASRASSPPSLTRSLDGSRSRPQTPLLSIPLDSTASPARPATPSAGKLSKRKSGNPGKHGSQPSEDGVGHHKAWIAGLREFVAYEIAPLLQGDRVPDLWNDQGDTLIYLYPPSSGRGPCFKIDSTLLAESRALTSLRGQSPSSPVERNEDIQQIQAALLDLSLSTRDLRPPSQASSSTYRSKINFSVPNISNAYREEKHVFLPLGFEADLSYPGSEFQGDDLELVVLYRNFFAFLAGGALVATARQTTLFAILMGIGTILKRYCFSNADGSTFGDVPSLSFSRYCDELRLADVRASREKTIEAIVLGEQLRSWPLYNEGFAHAVGRLADIKSIHSPKYHKMSAVTINRLERANLDIEQRLLTVRGKLEDFDFPSMFAGIANSQSSTEAKLVRFKEWKAGFLDFRRFTFSYYRRKYGAWPPKASSKKNNFEESGLNRVLLQDLYKDFTDLYDIMVDRTSITPRTVDMVPMSEDAETNDLNETIQHAIRRVESEYDRATPPVMPPIPFDTPLIPQFAQSFNRNHVVVSDKSVLQSKRLKENEVNEILLGSYNRESITGSTWIQDFFTYERRLGQGKTLDQVIDARCGQWLFIYAVLQALPMTVVDARDLQHTDGVEYFLCVAPRGGRPWMKEDQSNSRAWYNVASGGGMVSLPADLIDHSVEGVYRRSHCWTAATEWSRLLGHGDAGAASQVEELLPTPQYLSSEYPPYGNTQGSPYNSPMSSPMLRPLSPAFSNDPRSVSRDRRSLNIGLQALDEPLPPLNPRHTSVLNPNITFDAILSGSDDARVKGRKGKK